VVAGVDLAVLLVEVLQFFLTVVVAHVVFLDYLLEAATMVEVEDGYLALAELSVLVEKVLFVLFGPVTRVHSHQLVQEINNEPIH
jgi:hypothetical protein